MKFIAMILVFAALLAVLGSGCMASTVEDARKIFEASKDAVVMVQLVVEVKMTYEGQSEKQEHKGTANGTVIDPSGLTVVSLSDVDPSSQWPDTSSDKGSFSTEVTSVKMRMEDGTEIPADVVLRDPDLDLAFVKPKAAPAKPMVFVDLANASTPLVLDDMVSVGRLGRIAGFVAGATMERVIAVITKPRLFYAVSTARTGSPVFTLDGKVAGIALWRTSKSQDEDEESDWQVVVLPSAAVLKAAQQAKTAEPVKLESPKPAPAPTE